MQLIDPSHCSCWDLLSHINYGCVIHFHYCIRFSIKRNKREIIQILEYSKHFVFYSTLITHFSPHIPDVIIIICLCAFLPTFCLFFTHIHISDIRTSSFRLMCVCVYNVRVWFAFIFLALGLCNRNSVVKCSMVANPMFRLNTKMIMKKKWWEKKTHSLDDGLLKSANDRFQSLLTDLSATLASLLLLTSISYRFIAYSVRARFQPIDTT